MKISNSPDSEIFFIKRQDVQEAIHSNLNLPWKICSRYIRYSRRDVLSDMLPVYESLLAYGDLRILLFSGKKMKKKEIYSGFSLLEIGFFFVTR